MVLVMMMPSLIITIIMSCANANTNTNNNNNIGCCCARGNYYHFSNWMPSTSELIRDMFRDFIQKESFTKPSPSLYTHNQVDPFVETKSAPFSAIEQSKIRTSPAQSSAACFGQQQTVWLSPEKWNARAKDCAL